jgi:hypothetical protein
MDMHENNAVEMLRQGLMGDCTMNDDVVSSAVFLADRLEQLKRSSPLFDAVSFSPEVQVLLSTHLTAAAN